MELNYYYIVGSHFDASSLKRINLVLFYGKNLNELGQDILNYYERFLGKTIDMYNELYGKELAFNSSLYSQCISSSLAIAPIIALRDKIKSGKTLTEKDFASIDFELWADASESVRFSMIPQNYRDLRDLLASTADAFGFYDELPSDYEMCSDENRLIQEFDRCQKNWIRKQMK